MRERNRKSFIVLGVVVVAFTVFWHLYESGFDISIETFNPCNIGSVLVVMGLAFIAYGVSSKEPVDYTRTLKEINKNLVKLQNPEDREETLADKIKRRRDGRILKEQSGSDYEQLVSKYKPKQPGDDFAQSKSQPKPKQPGDDFAQIKNPPEPKQPGDDFA